MRCNGPVIFRKIGKNVQIEMIKAVVEDGIECTMHYVRKYRSVENGSEILRDQCTFRNQ